MQTLESKATNSKDAAEQEDASSPLPPSSPDFLPHRLPSFGPLKDALLGRRFTDEEMKQQAGSSPTFHQTVLRESHTASPAEVEEVC